MSHIPRDQAQGAASAPVADKVIAFMTLTARRFDVVTVTTLMDTLIMRCGGSTHRRQGPLVHDQRGGEGVCREGDGQRVPMLSVRLMRARGALRESAQVRRSASGRRVSPSRLAAPSLLSGVCRRKAGAR